ncbi:chorismate synthase [Candidatus Micrarchaeota archaeon]|nr:chorismate synthase [Candidatus Micrarchaeota archaeon]
MNTIGRMFRVSVLGESHGKCVGALIDGCPAGLEFPSALIEAELGRRKSGAKGTTARRESDEPMVMSGVFNGKTTGAPILILFENADADSSSYEKLKNTPRPSHADFASMKKYGRFADYRGGGHFSGRLTAGIVAAGAIAKSLLSKMEVRAHVIEAGGVKINGEPMEDSGFVDVLDSAIEEGDSLGAIVECRVSGVPAGLGEPFFDSLESAISHVAFSLPGIKGVEFGAGFSCARMRGSEFNDAIVDASGKTSTNNSGGINGGIGNSNELVFRVAVRPAASINKLQETVDLETGKKTEISIGGRHDACIALRVPVVLEAACAIVLLDMMLLEGKMKRVV